MKYLSLFSGIGGFELGIEKSWDNKSKTTQERQETRNTKKHSTNTGKQSVQRTTLCCIGYSEIDKYATAIYRYHYPDHENFGDATAIDTERLPDFDLLVGGFPCQSFSIAGKRKGMSGEDIRGALFFEIWRIARDKRPRTLLLENVPGLLSSQGGEDFQTILRSLDEIGYDVEWDCLNSKYFGVPQNRERLFIVGHLRGQGGRKVFPIGEVLQSVNQTGNERNISGTISTKNQSGQAQWDGSTTLIDAGGIQEIAVAIDANYHNGHGQGGESRGRTMVKTPKSIRRLTLTECERLMAFPDGWTEYGMMDGKKVKISDTQRYKCLGNAVVSNVVAEIVKEIL